jgi:hypothetical protein
MISPMRLTNLWKRRPVVLLFMHLIQDLDLVLPLLHGLTAREDFSVEICLIDRLLEMSPRIKSTFKSLGIQFSRVSRVGVLTGVEPNLLGVKALITVSESTAGPHKVAHALTKRANKMGLLTYTLQHGFENIGINYFDDTYPAESTKFAAQKVLIWGPTHLLPSELLDETRTKCVSVGCPKGPILGNLKVEIPERRKYLIAVLENLHWDRYTEEYRLHFLEDLTRTARHFPDVTFLLKPHHAGLWLTQIYDGVLPQEDNIIVADPKNPRWEVFTAPSLLSIADAAITTPSTVALDAAMAGCPVSIVGYGLNLHAYQPLPIISSLDDWMGFIKQLQMPQGLSFLQTLSCDYLFKNIAPGDAVANIVKLVVKDISGG